jgi:biopolymer transport protein ExbD
VKERKKNKGEAASLEMTPMIDVVFQLMIFFIVTLKQEDILAHLDVSRPQGQPPDKREEIPLLTVLVYKDGFVLQGQRVALEEMERQLTKLASYNPDVSVVIKCTMDSPHAYLMQLLDICAKANLTKLAVFSM